MVIISAEDTGNDGADDVVESFAVGGSSITPRLVVLVLHDVLGSD